MLDRLLQRWPLKLLAVAAAYAIWLSVSSQGRVFVDYDVPLELRIDEAFVVAGSAPDEVEVRLRGNESVLRNLDPLGLLMQVTVEPGGPGEHQMVGGFTTVEGGTQDDLEVPPQLGLPHELVERART